MSDIIKKQQKTLLSGGIVMAILNGSPKSYYQMDEDTNRILSCPVDCISKNFEGLKQSVPEVDEKMFAEGKTQTIEKDGKAITIGIDLSDSKGYRVVDGKEENWKQEKAEQPKYSFGLYGCWVSDNEHNLSYVEEDSYTEDMVKAQSEVIEKNKARGMHL